MARPNSRQTLIDYALRRLGAPVIEINVESDQVEDRVDDTLELFQEYHAEASTRTYLKHVVTAADIANKYIPISDNILYITKLFPVGGTSGSGTGMFSIEYQMHLNDIMGLRSFGGAGGVAYFVQTKQYLEMLDMTLNGTPQITFSRNQNRLYIHGDFNDGDIQEGDYLVAEVYELIDPETYTKVYNEIFIKEYLTQAIKYQWGSNMGKFEGVVLPGGVTISGQTMMQQAHDEMIRLEEKMRLVDEEPIDFFCG